MSVYYIFKKNKKRVAQVSIETVDCSLFENPTNCRNFWCSMSFVKSSVDLYLRNLILTVQYCTDINQQQAVNFQIFLTFFNLLQSCQSYPIETWIKVQQGKIKVCETFLWTNNRDQWQKKKFNNREATSDFCREKRERKGGWTSSELGAAACDQQESKPRREARLDKSWEKGSQANTRDSGNKGLINKQGLKWVVCF